MAIYTYLGREAGNNGVRYKIVDNNERVRLVNKEDLIGAIRKGVIIQGIKIDKLGRIYKTYGNSIEITSANTDKSKISRNSNKLILYHGSSSKSIKLTYGYGEDKHDYDKGFYLTPDRELAKEWATCSGNDTGYLHTFEVNLDGLKILEFDKLNSLAWIAELMKHRDADKSARYKIKSKEFISKYGIDTSGYDIIKGWRADSSYFMIAKNFVRGNVDVSISDRLLKLGELGVQYCLKSQRAIEINTVELVDRLSIVNISEYRTKYDIRDHQARENMRALIEDININKLEVTFDDLLR